MTPQQIQDVQITFKQLAQNPDAAAERFYHHLFALDPTLRPFFCNTHMPHQGQKLMAALAILIFNLEQLPTVPPTLRQLGARHRHHGIPAAAYATAKQALNQTIAEALGDKFTVDLQKAWAEVLNYLTDAMTHHPVDG